MPAQSENVIKSGLTGKVTNSARNWSLGLLFLATLLNLLDRQIINVLAQDIKVDLAISDAQLGLLSGTAFGIFYAIFGLPLGYLADRVDRSKLIAIALATWSAFTVLCGTATSYAHLFAMRMGVGIGEAGSHPASTSLIPDLFSEERRVTAMSVLLVGGSAGSFTGLLFGGYIAEYWGWRTAFVVAGIPGLVLAAVMWFTMKDPRGKQPANAAHALPLQSVREIVARPRFRWLALALLCSSFIVYACSAWLPPYFIRVHDMGTGEVGIFAAVAVGAGGAIGTLGGGMLCDRLRQHIGNIEFKMLVVGLALTVPTLAVVILAESRALAIGAWFLFNVVGFAWQGPTLTLIQQSVPTERRGLSIAVAAAVTIVTSQGIGLPLVGLSSDSLSSSFGPSAIGYALLMWVVGAAALGILAHWWAQRHR